MAVLNRLITYFACLACLNLANASETHWSKNEPFGHNIPQDLQVNTLDDVRAELAAAWLNVQRGETAVLVPQKNVADEVIPIGTLIRFPNGDLQVAAGDTKLRSRNRGKSWSPTRSNFYRYPCRTADGQTLAFTGRPSGGSGRLTFHPSENPEMVKTEAELVQSPDSGKTETIEPATIYLPATCKLLGLNHARIVQLADGSLLANAAVAFEEDPLVTYDTWVTKTGKVHAFTFQKNRVVVIHSHDGGKTWHYRATVAFDATQHTKCRIGGFGEPDMVVLQSGVLLCFMRTVAGGGIRPMTMSTSRDGGRTWSHADDVADRGVSPCVIQMRSGVIAVVYGRPHNWLMFSVDGGQNWVGHFQFYKGPKSWDAWNYCMLEEVAPDMLLVTYCRTDPTAKPGTTEARRGELVGTFFTVKRTKQ